VSIDPKIPGEVLRLRRSQRKFEAATSWQLEIAKAGSTPVPGYLNRQIIMLLSDLGISDEVFLDLQDTHRREIELMMVNFEKAQEVVRRMSRDSAHITKTMIR
jgi:RNA-dependent RNA polymerase